MLTPLRVLIVDDNAAAAAGLAALLEALGHLPHMTSNGCAALELLPELSPDLAFIDIDMPGMDGHEVAQRIRKLSEYSMLPMVAFTANDEDAVRRHRPRCEFDYHLSKPYRLEALKSLLQTIAARRAAGDDSRG